MDDKSSIFTDAVSRGQKGEFSDFQNWLQEHNVSPSSHDKISEELIANLDCTINQDEIIEEIGEYVGNLQAEDGKRHLVLKGVDGSGKTHISKLVENLVEKNEPNISLMRLKPDELRDEQKFSDIMSKLQKQKENKLVFLDDAPEEKRISYVLQQIKERTENILLITLWTPESVRLRYEEIAETFPKSDELYIDTLNEEETQKLVENIAERMLNENYSDYQVSREFVKQIYKGSRGVPKLTIEIFRQAIRQSFHMGERSLFSEKSVKDVVEKNGLHKADETLRGLSETKVHILEKILTSNDQRGLSPSQLAKDLKKDKSTISYHLRDLKNKNLIKRDSYGRQTFYTPKSSLKPIIQLYILGENQFYEHLQ